MSEVKHYRLDVYESNKSGEFETYVDMKESEPSRFTYVKSSDYDSLKAKLEKAEMILKEMLEDGLCLQGQEHDFAIGIRECLRREG